MPAPSLYRDELGGRVQERSCCVEGLQCVEGLDESFDEGGPGETGGLSWRERGHEEHRRSTEGVPVKSFLHVPVAGVVRKDC